MSERLTPEEEKAMSELTQALATELAKGTSKKKLVKELVKQDWQEQAATEFVDSVEQALEQYKNSPEGQRELAGRYVRHMLYGGLWAVGGTIVTAVTIVAASSGGFYVVAWGAIAFGAIEFLWGLFGWLKHRSPAVSSSHAYGQMTTSRNVSGSVDTSGIGTRNVRQATPTYNRAAQPQWHSSAEARPTAQARQVKCPFCRSSDIQTIEERGVHRCGVCHSVLPSYIK